MTLPNLALKGDKKRGNEIIGILEMLGGENLYNCKGDNDFFCYYITFGTDRINHDLYVDCKNNEAFYVITIEDFLEKYPYKIGDKVTVENGNVKHNVIIKSLYWDKKEKIILYEVKINGLTQWCDVYELQPYKEEDMEGVYAYNEINCYHQDFSDKVRIRLGNDFEIKVENNITYIVKKQSQYPKTYEECCEIIEDCADCSLTCFACGLLNTLQQLLVCRDAYWKIAGEQMGLGKPWEPDYNEESYEQGSPIKYVIYYTGTYITKEQKCTPSYVLSFPTEEIRDIFFENFKKEIEKCKELL